VNNTITTAQFDDDIPGPFDQDRTHYNARHSAGYVDGGPAPVPDMVSGPEALVDDRNRVDRYRVAQEAGLLALSTIASMQLGADHRPGFYPSMANVDTEQFPVAGSMNPSPAVRAERQWSKARPHDEAKAKLLAELKPNNTLTQPMSMRGLVDAPAPDKFAWMKLKRPTEIRPMSMTHGQAVRRPVAAAPSFTPNTGPGRRSLLSSRKSRSASRPNSHRRTAR
jgi:hypothetical protein